MSLMNIQNKISTFEYSGEYENESLRSLHMEMIINLKKEDENIFH